MKKRMMALFLTTVMMATMCGCGSKSDEKKIYKVATDTTFAPFEFENDEGKMVGIDLDLLKAIAEDQGFEYELEYVGFSAAVTALEAGEVDAVIAGMSITDERKEKYDFSDAYFDSGVGMGVLAGSDINSYEDLAGKQVAAKIGAEGCAFAESIADQYGFTIAQFEDSATMCSRMFWRELPQPYLMIIRYWDMRSTEVLDCQCRFLWKEVLPMVSQH